MHAMFLRFSKGSVRDLLLQRQLTNPEEVAYIVIPSTFQLWERWKAGG